MLVGHELIIAHGRLFDDAESLACQLVVEQLGGDIDGTFSNPGYLSRQLTNSLAFPCFLNYLK